MSAEDLLKGLDAEQEKAVTLETNGVVAAGAGSGKTKVLASRYVWLVTKKNLGPEEILTLTFTNKAVSEMYSRIYQYLLAQSGLETEGSKAALALKNFHKARINTLDSFSAAVARTAAPRYGISPDFTSDETALKDLARESALKFVLDNREAPAIRWLLSDHKIRDLAEGIFSQAVLKYSPISHPPELAEDLSRQRQVLLRAWTETGQQAETVGSNIVEALHNLANVKDPIKLAVSLRELLQKDPFPQLPDIGPLLDTSDEFTHVQIREELEKYFEFYETLLESRIPNRFTEEFLPLVENFRKLKGGKNDGLCSELESIANYALSFDLCAGIFELLKKFQDEFNAKKRETGFLSFTDIAHLAVDALRDHPDIRKVYKDSLRMIMVDEFQDNNALQRDLIYLLAENPERTEKSLARPEELEKNRMFLVGDEKQSIYRFRGADVAVFRSLGRTMDTQDLSRLPEGNIELIHNYRSRPGLIAVFNRIFGSLDEDSTGVTGNPGGVFLPPQPELPDYEAQYVRIHPPEKSASGNPGGNGESGNPDARNRDQTPLAHFCFLNEEDLPKDDAEGIKSRDLEAVFIAAKIREMVLKKEEIPRRTDHGVEWVKCSYRDFAVLERSYTHQNCLEKYFREFGIPYITDRPSGLFNDAPVLDLRAYLRLMVYPDDRIAYAALIRSPFVRLSDLSLAVCLLSENREPFAEENEDLLPKEDLGLYRRA